MVLVILPLLLSLGQYLQFFVLQIFFLVFGFLRGLRILALIILSPMFGHLRWAVIIGDLYKSAVALEAPRMGQFCF